MLSQIVHERVEGVEDGGEFITIHTIQFGSRLNSLESRKVLAEY